MEIKVKFENEAEVDRKIRMNMDKLGAVVREAAREAAEETRDFMEFRGREDIADAGNFGDDWQDAFQAEITETQRTIRVTAGMFPKGEPVVYWPVFEYGATITAKNPTGLLTWPNKSAFSIDGKVPAFISKHSVTIPKKFHLHEILKDEAKKASAAFRRIIAEKKQEARSG